MSEPTFCGCLLGDEPVLAKDCPIHNMEAAQPSEVNPDRELTQTVPPTSQPSDALREGVEKVLAVDRRCKDAPFPDCDCGEKPSCIYNATVDAIASYAAAHAAREVARVATEMQEQCDNEAQTDFTGITIECGDEYWSDDGDCHVTSYCQNCEFMRSEVERMLRPSGLTEGV